MIKLMSNGVEVRRGTLNQLEAFLELAYRGRAEVWAWTGQEWLMVEEV